MVRQWIETSPIYRTTAGAHSKARAPRKTSEQSCQTTCAELIENLGYAGAAEMQRKSSLAPEIARCIKARRLSQAQAADFLGTDQSVVSRITRGLFLHVSEQLMFKLITKLGHDARIVVRPLKLDKAPGKIQLEFA